MVPGWEPNDGELLKAEIIFDSLDSIQEGIYLVRTVFTVVESFSEVECTVFRSTVVPCLPVD